MLKTTSDFCIDHVAVDGRGGLWVGSACEHDRSPAFTRVGDATSTEYDAIVRAFAGLPQPPPARCPYSNDGRWYHEFSVLACESPRQWAPCPLEEQPAGGPGLVAEPFDSVRRLMLDVAGNGR